MSKQSEAVKKWRSVTKQRIVDSMGGKCQICEYNKCNEALELHHIDPNKKEFTMGQVMGRPISWTKIVNELRKCILLCANCHREVHNDVSIIPDIFSEFNEDFLEYRKKKVKVYKPRPTKVDWPNIDLQELMNKHNNYVKIGKILGVSDNAIRKRATKLGLI